MVVDNGSQNWFVYQPTVDKSTDSVLSWKSKGLYTSQLNPLYTAFLHNIKLSEYRLRKKFDEFPLAVAQSNCKNKIGNAYIFYDLYTCPKNPTNNFKIKNCLFGATNIVK